MAFIQGDKNELKQMFYFIILLITTEIKIRLQIDKVEVCDLQKLQVSEMAAFRFFAEAKSFNKIFCNGQ